MADTATATGYRKWLVTPSARPSEAMMKENSPICARPMPTRSEVRASLPAAKVPSVQLTILPSTTTVVMTMMGTAYSTSTLGSTSMPMVTKKMALNMSRRGSVMRSMSRISRDSAMMAPITKAPSAML